MRDSWAYWVIHAVTWIEILVNSANCWYPSSLALGKSRLVGQAWTWSAQVALDILVLLGYGQGEHERECNWDIIAIWMVYLYQDLHHCKDSADCWYPSTLALGKSRLVGQAWTWSAQVALDILVLLGYGQGEHERECNWDIIAIWMVYLYQDLHHCKDSADCWYLYWPLSAIRRKQSHTGEV